MGAAGQQKRVPMGGPTAGSRHAAVTVWKDRQT
uniref:Uncharacterized protein n=1 Tax=Siphoviridae sp. ctoiW10 TaxID=2827592 RepID=A0A8S5LPE7_9CAUD|nr:MAG TPA: hypothetical protein [Siphoviridae sp. ctoiW10]